MLCTECLEGVNSPTPPPQMWLHFHVKVKVDCWSSPRDHQFAPSPSPQDQQRKSPFHVKVKVDCWSPPRWLSICPPPPGSTDCFSVLIVDHLHIDCQSTSTRINSIDHLRIDCWSTPSTFLIFNIRMLSSQRQRSVHETYVSRVSFYQCKMPYVNAMWNKASFNFLFVF